MTKVLCEMTRKVIFANETDHLDDVWNSMQALGVRHLPVLRDHKVVGILSDRDILAAGAPQKGGGVKVPHKAVRNVMTKAVITCSISDSIGAVAKVFIEQKIDALPVTRKNGELVGIITSTDLLLLLRDKGEELFRELPFQWEPESLLDEQWRPAVC